MHITARAVRRCAPLALLCATFTLARAVPLTAGELTHPRLMTDQAGIDTAKEWIKRYPWYRNIFDAHREEIDRLIAHGPIYVSPLKQTYVYQMYTCPKHGVELIYDALSPFAHRCPVDTTEVYSGGKYDMAWAGWYNRLLGSDLVWMGLLYQVTGEERYAVAGRQILVGFAGLYLRYTTDNTILGPAHVFFGTLSESFWGVDMAYGYDLLYNYRGFTPEERSAIKEKLFLPLASITQKFPETASNRQLWYNNVSAAVGFMFGDSSLVNFAINGRYGFRWQLGSALPESGFWAEWSGYHFVTLRGMIHLAEMARHNGIDLYHMSLGGRTMKSMFDAPLLVVQPNYEFPRSKDSGGGNLLEYAAFYEVGYAVYRDPRYLALLARSGVKRGSQIVGETSALGRAPEPVSMFDIVPELPLDSRLPEVYTERSVNLAGNGFAILRDSLFRTYLYLDYGIMGGEHGHPDRLQMGYYAAGRNWIVDPLNESYMFPSLQLWYHRSIAHNTLVVDETDQAWTNGYCRFFDTTKGFQVASGGSTTEYHGVRLTRTLIQVSDREGSYFIDLFDAASPDVHTYDLPLHGFGRLSVDDLVLEPQPVDLFGNRPGIPGYDQLTSIRLGTIDSAFHGDFIDGNDRLTFRVIGEPGTTVISALTPPIGGFYKQSAPDKAPFPVLITRRVARATRFATLIHAAGAGAPVTAFLKGDAPDTYIVERNGGRDVITADVANSVFSIRREREDQRTLSSSTGVVLPEAGVHELRVSAPGRQGNATRPLTLYQGTTDTLVFSVTAHANALRGSLRVQPSPGWKEATESRLNWWGGIVNLVATNKRPVERLEHAAYAEDPSWFKPFAGPVLEIPPGTSTGVSLAVIVPPDAAPVSESILATFGVDTLRPTVSVAPPVSARMFLPNGTNETLALEFTNNTAVPQTLSAALAPDPAWKPVGVESRRHGKRPIGAGGSFPRMTVTLTGSETKRIDVPIRLGGYTTANQRYPIRLRLECGRYSAEIVHDFYAGIARPAKTPPSLDGSWRGWNRSDPMTIDSASQIGRLLFGNQPWHGRRDLSADVYAMYDSAYLYVGADVTDDSVVSHWDFPRMEYPWDTDCMEVVVDARTNSLQGFDPPTPGTYRHLCLAEYRHTDFSAIAWQGAGAPDLPKPNLVPGGETYFHRTEKGYTMIARFPLAGMPGIVARPGFKVGFDVALNDNDGTSFRKNQHIWAGYEQNQSWWDLGTIGALIFGN
ncbi:MAG TPA: sugar-binding protein [Bacteroidota bacterium]|nr:sugar-binding protein [Bacteroidota bacterium]